MTAEGGCPTFKADHSRGRLSYTLKSCRAPWGKHMAEERLCLITLFDGRADWQSLDQLNRLLDEGWRIAGINPSLRKLEGVGNMKGFMVELKRIAPESG